MRYLWTEYALDYLDVGLLFAHQHQPSLFFLSTIVPLSILSSSTVREYCPHGLRSPVNDTHLEDANLFMTHLENAHLDNTHLEGADLRSAHLEGANLLNTHLEGCDLREAFFDSATALRKIYFGDEKNGYISLCDIHWGDVNLTTSEWMQVSMLGNEYEARKKKYSNGMTKSKETRLDEYEKAVRANRQLAVALQSQGLNEVASHFAYRAQLCRCVVLRHQKKFGQYLFSHFLNLLAGYGYRPGRSLIWYLVTIFGFTLAYHFLGGLTLYPPDAFVFSIMSFHGRGFFPALSQEINLHNPLVMLAAGEAIVGLLIEISFIATFTQRFFGR